MDSQAVKPDILAVAVGMCEKKKPREKWLHQETCSILYFCGLLMVVLHGMDAGWMATAEVMMGMQKKSDRVSDKI